MGCALNFLISLLFTLAMLLGISFPVIQAPIPAMISLPCTVITERADVPVRVGPGENRAVRLFLPAGEPIAVIGQATIDGAGWWQVELAGVEQAWIAQADVESAGDCASVPDTDAPPVIPGQAPSAPVGDAPADEPSVGWGTCGSCDSCDGPADQCVSSPEGLCVWDAARCGGGSSVTGGDPNCVPEASEGSVWVYCSVYGDGSAALAGGQPVLQLPRLVR